MNFNSHTREGVTCPLCEDDTLRTNFNSHTREGVTGDILSEDDAESDFNSHTREGVTSPSMIFWNCSEFQLTHP